MDDVQTSKKKMPSKKEWRGFYSLILIQAQNAFNEKAAQFLLIPLGVWLAANSAVYGPDSWVNSLQYILACIFVLPYILFSPFVGWLADCFCKARIIQFMSFLSRSWCWGPCSCATSMRTLKWPSSGSASSPSRRPS